MPTRIDPYGGATGPRTRRRAQHHGPGGGYRPGRGTVVIASVTAVALLAAAIGLGLWLTGGSDPERPAYAGEPVEVQGLYSAEDVSIGPDGSLYAVDSGPRAGGQGQVLRLRPDGSLTRVAGVGPPAPTPTPTGGPSASPPASSPSPSPTLVLGDGGPAERSNLIGPHALAVGGDGEVYIADTDGDRIRLVDGKTITTVAGTAPDEGFGGASGQAAKAALSSPLAVVVSDDGVLYFTDGYRVRKVTPDDGLISVVAGSADTWGTSGDGGQATKAMFSKPAGLALADDGTLYISDYRAHTVRKITPDGRVTRVAGKPDESGRPGDNGLAVDALLSYPQDLALGPKGELYIADSANNAIRVVSLDGKITTFAGSSEATADIADGGLATQTRMMPRGLAVDVSGAVYVSEGDGGVRRIGPDGIVSTVLRAAEEED